MRKTLLIAICLCCLTAADAWAVKVGDITRIGGQRRNFLVGSGLVVGFGVGGFHHAVHAGGLAL